MKNQDELSDEALGYASLDTLGDNNNINPGAFSERQIGLLHGFIDGYESCKKDVNDMHTNNELKNEASNITKPVLGDVYVFELKDGKMKQISIRFESIKDANSFIETMKEGMYYKSIRPDCILIAMEVLNFA